MSKGRSGTICLIACAALLLLFSRASAKTWKGAGANDNWSTMATWIGSTPPANNGTANVTFAGTTRLTPNVDVAYNINSLISNNTAGSFNIGGAALTIGAGGMANNTVNIFATFNNSILISAPQTWTASSGGLLFNGPVFNQGNLLTFSASASISSLSGVLSGAGGLTKEGSATLALAGSSANSFSGTVTVNAGLLLLEKPANVDAFTGALIIGDGSGSETVRLDNSNQTDFANVTVNSSGLFNLNNFSEAITGLTINGGSVTMGTGTLSAASAIMTAGSISSTGAGKFLLQGFLNTNASATPATISGTLDLNSVSHNFNINDGTAFTDLDISGAVLNGAITKNGAGTLPLNGNLSSTAGNSSAVINGNLNLGGAVRTFTIENGGASPDLSALANIFNGTLIKNGSGELSLGGNNNITGVVLNDGTL